MRLPDRLRRLRADGNEEAPSNEATMRRAEGIARAVKAARTVKPTPDFTEEDPDLKLRTLFGRMIESGDTGADIMDGLMPHLPRLLPRSLREELEAQGPDNVQKYITEAYGAAISSYTAPYKVATRFQFDSPYQGRAPYHPIYEDPLCEWEYPTRCYILEQCQAAYKRNVDAKLGVRLIAAFAIGEGFQLVTYNELVAELLNRFIDHPENNFKRIERQAARSLLVNGEYILRWYMTGAGVPVVVPKRPWELAGIMTEMGHYAKPLSYEFYSSIDDGMTSRRRYRYMHEPAVPAELITYVAINNEGTEQRGRPELYPILPWFGARKGWLENRARINYWLACLVWLVRVDAISPAHLAAVAARWGQGPPPGSVSIEHINTEVEALQASPAAMNAVDDGRQLLLQIAKGFGLPEFMMADGYNANMATATAQMLPALEVFAEYQRVMRDELVKPVLRKVVELAVDDGMLPYELPKMNSLGEATGEMVLATEAFEVSYRPVVEPDLKALTEALAAQVSASFISKRMAREQLGVDVDKAEKEIEEEKEQAIKDARAGFGALPMLSPGAMPEDDEEDEEDEEEDDDE